MQAGLSYTWGYFEKFVVSNPFYWDNNGSYNYNGGGIYSSGNPVLDYFLGIPDTYTQQSGGFIDAIAWEYYAYAQDSWKVFNHANFALPDGNFLDGTFGAITSVIQPANDGGDPQPGRAVQIGGKIAF